MPDYKHLTAIEAVRHAKDVSGKTVEKLATATGISQATLRRYLQNEDGYSPGLDKLPRLIRGLGNVVILEWLEAQLEAGPEGIEPAKSRAEIMTAVARAAADIGDCQRLLADSEEIDPACARELRSLLKEAADQCQICRAMLDELAAKRDWLESGVLASLKKERKWWEIWK